MFSKTLLLIFSLIASITSAYSQTFRSPKGFPPPGPPPPFPRDVPPGFEKVLPPDVLAQLRSIHRDDSLSWRASIQKHEKIDAIMNALPTEILDKLPLPPGFDKLPQDVQQKIRAAHRERNLTWQQKHQKIHSIIDSLPENIKRLIPPPPPPPGFDKLPKDVQAKLRAVHEDRSLTWEQRHRKIHSIIMSLPENVRRLLPPPPPWFRRNFKNMQKLDADE